VVWMCDHDKIFTVGFSRQSDRQYAVWDPRDLSQPLVREDIDVSSGLMLPFYDEDSKIMYLAGKGDANIRYFEIVDEDPYVHFLSQYQSTTPHKGAYLLPKRVCDVSCCEIGRCLRLNSSVVEPVSFRVPRKVCVCVLCLLVPASRRSWQSCYVKEALGESNRSRGIRIRFAIDP